MRERDYNTQYMRKRREKARKETGLLPTADRAQSKARGLAVIWVKQNWPDVWKDLLRQANQEVAEAQKEDS